MKVASFYRFLDIADPAASVFQVERLLVAAIKFLAHALSHIDNVLAQFLDTLRLLFQARALTFETRAVLRDQALLLLLELGYDLFGFRLCGILRRQRRFAFFAGFLEFFVGTQELLGKFRTLVGELSFEFFTQL